MGEMSEFEASADMGEIAKKSLEQVEALIAVLLQFVQRGVPVDAIGSRELSDKIFDYANRNVTGAFDFAKMLIQVKSPHELVSMQSEFVQAQIRAVAEQSDGLNEAAMKALIGNRGRC